MVAVVMLLLVPASAGATVTPWATQAAPAPAGPSNSALAAVSCVSASWCMALGRGDNGLRNDVALDAESFAEVGNGGVWATAPITPALGQSPLMTGLSCTSRTFCLAVGSVSQQQWGPTSFTPIVPAVGRPVAEVWNGTTWALTAPPPRPRMNAGLIAVSCLSSRDCIAVGATGNVVGGNGVLVDVFNGTRWRLQRTPRLPHDSGVLDAVSCVASDDCTAVGDDNNEPAGAQEGAEDALVEHWNGRHWYLQRSLYSRPQDGNVVLTGVSCGSRSRCLAVGTLGLNGGAKPRAELWNGKRWIATARLPVWSALNGVSCTSATACVAVGQYQPSYYPPASVTEPLVENWNGKRWAKQTVPNAPAPTGPNLSHLPIFPTLNGVSCIAADMCTAVGGSGSGGSVGTLVQSNLPSAPSAVA
jgi:hypothetical protein